MTEVVLDPGPLPVGPYDRKGGSWWGVICLIATEAALFGSLFFAYYFYDFQLPHSWRPDTAPRFDLSGPATVIMLVSTVALWVAERAIKKGARLIAALGLLVGLILGVAFVVLQILEWRSLGFAPNTSTYGSIYFVVGGFHMAHLVVGLVAMLFVLIWTALGYFDEVRHAAVSNTAAYWYFVNAVWLATFFTFYISPYLW